MSDLNRRRFLAASAASVPMFHLMSPDAGAGSSTTTTAAAQPAGNRAAPSRPVAISSRNGLPAVSRAMAELRDGADPLDAAIAGVNIVEDDPEDMSVGYGGLPNERGVVELDACVMHGPSHKAGAVAALQNIRHPSKVARLVMDRTDHVLIVGEGARQFAVEHGFEEEDLLTDRARQAWLAWRARQSRSDNWLDDDQRATNDSDHLNKDDIPHTDGTIHCAAVNNAGDVGALTSTSGLSYKLAGRVGDSPIIGAGNFVDNLVGAAGATGRGESVIQSCGAFQVVQHMDRGDEPTEACLKVLKWIANHTRRRMLKNDRGEPNFQVVLYALRKDGAYGSACMRKGRTYTVHDGNEARSIPCAYLYE